LAEHAGERIPRSVVRRSGAKDAPAGQVDTMSLRPVIQT